ncbi:M48 family peptidase [Nitrosospira lacus]|uniref:Zinc metalloprotease n=1 Tax=Nitrosospira lacus TaxID=1288494 RepID=A0A1W6SMW7_9PROT|nr:SprT family zinc-dependent metalloprotease [Nitrosospira lacus]ARO87153.1 M48 family peptidase [Nitrosospira lacus]
MTAAKLSRTPKDKRTAPADEIRRVCLNGKEVAYTLKRCKRRTIGMKIDSEGLTVRIPLRESLHWVESVLRNKADWVVEKLDEWRTRKLYEPVWEEGAIFPLLGEPWQLAARAAGVTQMTRATMKTGTEDRQMQLPLLSVLTPRQIEKIVMDWYCNKAIACFSERIALYADKLGVALPQLRLSRARTQWGSCNTHGIVHLNWRLIQMPLHLVDYVVAHELSHLIEMNHSPAFWQTVGRVYPDYVAARKELKRLG